MQNLPVLNFSAPSKTRTPSKNFLHAGYTQKRPKFSARVYTWLLVYTNKSSKSFCARVHRVALVYTNKAQIAPEKVWRYICLFSFKYSPSYSGFSSVIFLLIFSAPSKIVTAPLFSTNLQKNPPCPTVILNVYISCSVVLRLLFLYKICRFL